MLDKKQIATPSSSDSRNEQQDQLRYDSLLLCVGSSPRIPKVIDSLDYSGDYIAQLRASKRIMLCKNYADAQKITQSSIDSCLIIGAGLIGMEIAWSIQTAGGRPTVLDHGDRPLAKYFDPEYLDILETECEENNITLWPRARVVKMEELSDSVQMTVERDIAGQVRVFQCRFGHVVICSGFAPNTGFLSNSQDGPQSISGVIKVTETQQTSIPGVYAAGDCCFSMHGIIGKPVYLPLATNAVRGGLAASYKIASMQKLSALPTNGCCAVQLFDYSMAAVGLQLKDARFFFPAAKRVIYSDFLWHEFCARKVDKVIQPEALSENFDFFGQTVRSLADMSVESFDLQIDQADDQVVSQILVYDRDSGRILGSQVIGKQDVTQMINAASVAISKHITVEELSQIDFGGFDGEQKPWDVMRVTAASTFMTVPDFEAFDTQSPQD